MVGTDDHVAIIGDWVAPDPSPRSFFSSVMNDDFGSRSFPVLLGDSRCEGPFVVSSEKLKVTTNLEEEDGTGVGVSGDRLSESSVLSEQKSSSHGGLVERMAARAGFNAPRLNTARIRSANTSSSPEVRSPYLTIPPGLSPTTLLDSPVFLSNSLAQPSPTTGKFSFIPSNNGKASMSVPDKDMDNPFEYVDISSFVFKPHVESSSSFFLREANKETPASNPQQSFTSIELSVQSERTLWSPNLESTEVHSPNKDSFHPWADFPKSSDGSDTNGKNVTLEPRVSDPVIAIAEHSSALDDQQDQDGNPRSNREMNSMVVGCTTSEDGYNWRKYGQKQVKGSEYPRSYYKCTHPNCQVKKKVERSHEGHITEIIYKGAHSHPKPTPNRRSAVGSYNAQNGMQLDITEHAGVQAGAESDPVWASSQIGNGCPDWGHENLEATLSASVDPEFCVPSTSMQAQKDLHFDATIAVDVSSTMSNNEDEDDRGTHGSVSLGYDGEGDESESKRRKLDEMEVGGAARAIREPRVVVQTTSEVDILDDGYRWRKYGQKVVKGNPNPRSYYKCTNAGCTVRKHVERASHDLKSVITTYEGKHNHDVPAARNSSHMSSGPSSALPSLAAQSQLQRPESSQIRNSMARFDGPASLGTFGLPGRGQPGLMPSFSFGMSQSGLANLAMAGLGPGLGKLSASPPHSYLGQQSQMNEVGHMILKGEPKNEPATETGLNLSSNSPSVYQIMGRLPLGSQT